MRVASRALSTVIILAIGLKVKTVLRNYYRFSSEYTALVLRLSKKFFKASSAETALVSSNIALNQSTLSLSAVNIFALWAVSTPFSIKFLMFYESKPMAF